MCCAIPPGIIIVWYIYYGPNYNDEAQRQTEAALERVDRRANEAKNDLAELSSVVHEHRLMHGVHERLSMHSVHQPMLVNDRGQLG